MEKKSTPLGTIIGGFVALIIGIIIPIIPSQGAIPEEPLAL